MRYKHPQAVIIIPMVVIGLVFAVTTFAQEEGGRTPVKTGPSGKSAKSGPGNSHRKGSRAGANEKEVSSEPEPTEPVESIANLYVEEKKQALEAYSRKDDSALEKLKSASSHLPSDAELYYALGDAYVYAQQWEEAIKAYDKALLHSKASATSATADNDFNLGTAYLQIEKPRLNDALDAFKRADEKKPNDPRTLKHLGDLSREMTHWQEAISYYRRVLELNPDISDPNFFFNFAMALVKIGDHDAAIRRFTLAIQLNIDKVAEAYYQQGTALKELRRDQEAIAAFENQLQKKNDDELAGKAYFNLAELYQKQDNWEAAVRANDGATRLRPDDAFSWDRLGFVLNNVGRFAESAEAHRKAAMLRPDRFEYQFRLGKQLYRADKYREAIEVLTKATELQPKSSEAFYFLGVSYRSNEQYDQAVAALTTALELGLRPRSVEGSARYNLAVAYKKSGNVSAARQQCDLVKLMGSDYPGDSQNVCGP